MVKNLSKLKKSKNKKSEIEMHIRAIKKFTFLIPSTKKAFNCLWQAFVKAVILQHFDPKDQIQIETDS